MDTPTTIASLVREHFEQSGLSNSEFSRRAGIARPTLLRRISPDSPHEGLDFSVAELLRVAAALDVELFDLVPPLMQRQAA